jgi:hypothetical protein
VHVAHYGNKGPKVANSFIMCMRDVESLVFSIRECTSTTKTKLTLKFRLQELAGSRISIKHQRGLLLPFTKLRGHGQRCIISGQCDDVLAAEISSKIGSPIHWKRDQIRSYLDMVTKDRARADDTFLQGNHSLAWADYRYLLAFIEAREVRDSLNKSLTLLREIEVLTYLTRVIYTTKTFVQVASIISCDVYDDVAGLKLQADPHYHSSLRILPEFQSMHMQLRGIANLHRKQPRKALEHFTRASDIASTPWGAEFVRKCTNLVA